MFINRNPFLSWHVYSSIDHYIKLHHYHIKKLNTNYLVYKTQSDFSLPPIMSWIKTCHTIPQFAGLNFVTVFLFICTIISWTRVQGQLQIWTEHSTLILENLKPVEKSKNNFCIIWTSSRVVLIFKIRGVRP